MTRRSRVVGSLRAGLAWEGQDTTSKGTWGDRGEGEEGAGGGGGGTARR